MSKHWKVLLIMCLAIQLTFNTASVSAAPGNLVSTQSTAESTSQTQTQTFTIPDMTSLVGVTSNTGAVEVVSASGNQVTVRTSGGASTRTVQTGGTYIPGDSKQVSVPGSGSIGQTMSYNQGGYSGTLTYSTSTSAYISWPAYSYSSSSCGPYNSRVMQHIYYDGATQWYISTYTELEVTGDSAGGYQCGNDPGGSDRYPAQRTIYTYSAGSGMATSYTPSYTGTVVKPAVDTRTYATYYKYNLTFTYITDDVPPTVKLAPSKKQPTNTEIVIGATVSDDNSGVMEKKWVQGDKSKAFFHSGGNELSSTFTVFENDTYTVYAQDVAGNETIAKININNIDTSRVQVPRVVLDNTKETKGNVLATITYPAKAVKKHFSKDGVIWSDYTSPVRLTQNGNLFARAIDSSGNVSPVARTTINNINREGVPNPKFKLNNSGITKDDVIVDINFPENSVKKEFVVNGSGWKAYDTPVKMTGNGVVKARAIDSAGNVSSVTTTRIKNIDKVAPEVLILGLKENGVYTGSAKYSIDSYDYNQHNVEIYLNGKRLYEKTITEKGSHTLKVVATDMAGNSVTEKINIKVK